MCLDVAEAAGGFYQLIITRSGSFEVALLHFTRSAMVVQFSGVPQVSRDTDMSEANGGAPGMAPDPRPRTQLFAACGPVPPRVLRVRATADIRQAIENSRTAAADDRSSMRSVRRQFDRHRCR